MNRVHFINDPEVNDFSEWLIGHLPRIPVNLAIRRSRFVPHGVQENVEGIHGILEHYVWCAPGVPNGRWNETQAYLTGLATNLRNAVAGNQEGDALDCCRQILNWGGNRNWYRGAFPFLQQKSVNGQLCAYIRSAGDAFSLENADTDRIVPPVEQMNAMLTKVHALYAEDGLPIYDSRVAAATASLVEQWRRAAGREHSPLPSTLKFPATLRTRTVLRVFPDAIAPGVLTYGCQDSISAWSEAKVRLGWLMWRILRDNTAGLFADLVEHGPLALGMRAFEASLFMIGYDVACLTPRGGQTTPERVQKATRRLLVDPKSRSDVEDGGWNAVRPLSGRGANIDYAGSIESAVRVTWGKTTFVLEAEQIDEIVAEFCGREVLLGANMAGAVPDGSLGQWLTDNGWPSPRYASAVAAILEDLGLIAEHRGRAPITLIFAGCQEPD